MNELLKEKIKYYTEWIRILSAAVLAAGTGVISLCRLEKLSEMEYFLLFSGIFLTFMLLLIIAALNASIRNKIKNLSK